MTQHKDQPEALRLAALFDEICAAFGEGIYGVKAMAAAELRRQHDEIAELRTQLDAIGAGGVSPLRRSQCLHQIDEPQASKRAEFTPTAREALLWVLWHHQGGSSKVGQPIRYALGMGQHDRLSADQVRQAQRWAGLAPLPTPPSTPGVSDADQA